MYIPVGESVAQWLTKRINKKLHGRLTTYPYLGAGGLFLVFVVVHILVSGDELLEYKDKML
jgi:hypothetical protein